MNLAHLQGGNASEQGIAQLVGSVERIAGQVTEVRSHLTYMDEQMVRSQSFASNALERLAHQLSVQADQRLGAAEEQELAARRVRDGTIADRALREVVRAVGGGAVVLDDYLRPRMEVSPPAGVTDEQREEARRRGARFGFTVVFSDQPEFNWPEPDETPEPEPEGHGPIAG